MIRQDMNINEVREATKSFLDGTLFPGVDMEDISQAKLARAAGFAGSALTQFLKVKYPVGGESEKNVAEKLKDYFLILKERLLQVTPEITFILTKEAVQIISLIKFLHISKEFGVVSGASGVGKTMTCRHYVKTNRNAKYVTCYEDITPRAFFKRVLKAYGRTPTGGVGDMVDEIIDTIDGSSVILIVDEAQKLRKRIIEQLRHIKDETGIALVLVGSDEITTQMSNHYKYKWDQVDSRMAAKRKVKPSISRSDVAKMIETTGITLAKEIVDFLHDIARGGGHYRRIKHCLKNAFITAKERNETPGIEYFRQAIGIIRG